MDSTLKGRAAMRYGISRISFLFFLIAHYGAVVLHASPPPLWGCCPVGKTFLSARRRCCLFFPCGTLCRVKNTRNEDALISSENLFPWWAVRGFALRPLSPVIRSYQEKQKMNNPPLGGNDLDRRAP